jgi:hypothetical protein
LEINDPKQFDTTDFFNTHAIYRHPSKSTEGKIDERMSDFLERHNLIAKFHEEDEAGQR